MYETQINYLKIVTTSCAHYTLTVNCDGTRLLKLTISLSFKNAS